MNCDEFLMALETGDAEQRRLAQQHAGNCPRCQADWDMLKELKRELGDVPPLSQEARRWWEQACPTEVSPARLTNWQQRIAIVGFVTGLCASLFFLYFAVVPRQPDPPQNIPGDVVQHPVETVGEVTVTEIDAAAQLSDLSADLDRLDAEISALRREAERRDAERQFAVLLKRFDRW